MTTPKKAIVTRYHPPTATLGARVSAKDLDNNRVMIPYPEHLPFGEPRHRAAAEALCKKMNWQGADTLVAGQLSHYSWVYVFCEDSQLRECRARYERASDDAVVKRARTILEGRLRTAGDAVSSPDVAKDYLRTRLCDLQHEVFYVLFLDVKNRLIKSEEMFRGTLTHTSIYPREVVKAALRHNAAGVLLCHNHPSGVSDPSEADLRLTATLVQALGLINVRVLDHFIVAGQQVHSFAEHDQL
jgi:DNA repair protein RadC